MKQTLTLAFARAGLEYLRLLQENDVLVERWNQSGKTDTEARDAALANWEQIEKLSAEHPFMVNPNYVNRKNHKRMGRFLPVP